MRFLSGHQNIKRILSGFLLSVIFTTSFLVFAEPAVSSTPVTFTVKVQTVNEDDEVIPVVGELVDFCHSGSGIWTCAHETNSKAVTDSLGLAEIQVSLPRGTGYVQLETGGYRATGEQYSREWAGVEFVDGAPAGQPVIELVETTYRTVTVTVKSDGTPPVKIKNEFVELSSGEFGDDSDAMREWAITDNDGKAVFHLDRLRWADDSVINAAVGLDSWSRYALTTGSVDIATGTATIEVASTTYRLTGNIKREDTQSPSGFVNFANEDFCLAFNDDSTGEWLQIDFSTDAAGNYAVENVLSRNLQFHPHACDSYDEFSPFDWQDGVTVAVGATVADLKFVAKGLKVKALEGGNPEKPAAFVQLRIDLQEGGSSVSQQHRLATTNADGVAYFNNLQPGAEYLLSYRAQDDPWSTPRFENNPDLGLITIEDSLTSMTISLDRKAGFPPETPVKVSGTVQNPGILNGPPLANVNSPGTALANALVNVTSSFGFNQRVTFRARTNDNGFFEISGLPHGWISVDVSAVGYRPISSGFQTDLEDDDPEYDLGILRLRSSLSGNLEYAGVLRDVDGEPVPDIKLVLNHPYDSGKEPEFDVTDDSGRFSFTGLSTGHHWMYAQANWEIYDWNSWGFNLQGSNLRASHVILERGVLNPDAVASISGRVFEYLDVEGPSSPTPIENVCVQLYPTAGGSVSVGRTDSLGYWSVSGLLDEEEYWIDTPRNCETNAELGYNFVTEYERPDYGNSLAIAKESEFTLHEWAFKKVSESGPGSVSGRVRDGDSYQNLAGVEIYLERANGGRVSESVTTDSRGEYEFLNLPAGEYYISTDPEPFVDGEAYGQAWMSVEVTTEPNRANVLLYKPSSVGIWDGIFSGTLLDEYGDPHSNARVIITNPDEYFWQGYAETDHEGWFEISDLPVNANLLYRIIPWWQELAVMVGNFMIDESRVEDLSGILGLGSSSASLGLGSSISGQMSNIPQGVEVRKIFAELLDDRGRFVHSAEVDLKTGQYSLKRVPAGEDYVLRFTQNVSVMDWFNWSEPARQSVSMKPVYWKEGSVSGTTELIQATKISVGSQPVLGKNVFFSEGSTLQGSVSIATATNPIPLSGARQLYVDLFKCDPEGEDCNYVTWSELSAKTDYKFQFVGLAPGNYKVQFIDTRQGNNSLIMNFNGGAGTLEDARVIPIDDSTTPVVLSHTMSIAPPETSAEAFDLNSLGALELAELKDAISLEPESSPGSEIEVFVGTEFAGNFVSAFANSTPVVLGGWQQVDSLGYIKVNIPTTLPVGSHRIGVQDSQSTVIGWSPISIKAPEAVTAQPASTNAKPKTSKGIVEEEPEDTVEEAQMEEKAPITDAAAPAANDSSGDWLLPLAGGFILILAAGSAWALRAQRLGVRRK